jgi:4a-hydroxytetrahydrobiopterin dehydratase
MDTITAKEFRASSGVEEWHAGVNGASVTYRTGDFATGAALFDRIAKLADAADHHPDVDVRYPTVRVHLFTHSARGLTAKDVSLAQQISSAARELGVDAETTPPQRLMIAVATPEAERIMPFWQAATGYDAISDTELVDRTGRGPLIWMQRVDRSIGGRMHLDIVVPKGEAEARVAAIVEAGGIIADDTHAPRWWTMADADGHKVDITPSRT